MPRGIGLALAVLTLCHDAAAEPATVSVACPLWTAEEAAAFEARAHAELALRGLLGELAVDCGDQLVVRFRNGTAAAPLQAQRENLHPSVDEALTLADELLEKAVALGRSAALQPPPPAASRPEQSRAQTPPEPPTRAPSPLPTANTRGTAPQATDLPPKTNTPGPQTVRTRDPSRGIDSATSPARATLGGGVRAGLWSNRLSLGGNTRGTLTLIGRWGALLDLDLATLLDAPTDYSMQAASAVTGLRFALASEWSVAASAGLSLTQIHGQSLSLNAAELDSRCQAQGSFARCWGLSGKVDASFSPGRGSLRPRFGVELAWAPTALQITQGAESLAIFSLPRIRPSLLLGVEWGIAARPE